MKRYKIGYLAGVFDLFHIGHLNIIRKAKNECDYLIVAVSTDELASSYKQKKPVIPYEYRKKILEAIQYCDLVVPQKTIDKMDAFKKYKFDVIFVGDDWKKTPRWEKLETQLRAVNSKVVYFKYTKGISTSRIIDIIKKELI